MAKFTLRGAQKLSFQIVGQITIPDNFSEMKIDESYAAGTNAHWVYLWIATKQAKPARLLYVGQTSVGLLKRANTHNEGFRGRRSTGKRNHERIEGLINNDRYCVQVWARESGRYRVFGVDVPGPCIEERALISLWKPEFNSGKEEGEAY